MTLREFFEKAPRGTLLEWDEGIDMLKISPTEIIQTEGYGIEESSDMIEDIEKDPSFKEIDLDSPWEGRIQKLNESETQDKIVEWLEDIDDMVEWGWIKKENIGRLPDKPATDHITIDGVCEDWDIK